jgi:hypothetical protein
MWSRIWWARGGFGDGRSQRPASRGISTSLCVKGDDADRLPQTGQASGKVSYDCRDAGGRATQDAEAEKTPWSSPRYLPTWIRRPHWLNRSCCRKAGRRRQRICLTDFPYKPSTIQETSTIAVAARSRSACYSETCGLPGKASTESRIRRDPAVQKEFQGAIKSRFSDVDTSQQF